jgi:hypothetical protein
MYGHISWTGQFRVINDVSLSLLDVIGPHVIDDIRFDNHMTIKFA